LQQPLDKKTVASNKDKNIADENKYLVKRMIAKIACKKIFKTH